MPGVLMCSFISASSKIPAKTVVKFRVAKAAKDVLGGSSRAAFVRLRRAAGAERQTADQSLQSLREAQGYLRTLTAACRAMIQAREKTADPVAAIERLVGWEKFVRCVTQAESLGRPAKSALSRRPYPR